MSTLKAAFQYDATDMAGMSASDVRWLAGNSEYSEVRARAARELSQRTITDAQIAALRDEAGQAGDDAQVKICTAALDGDTAARSECERVIADATA
jgi:hypothetical protein